MNIGVPNDPGIMGHSERADRMIRFNDIPAPSPNGEKTADRALADVKERLREALCRLDDSEYAAFPERGPATRRPGEKSAGALHATLGDLQNDFMDALYAALEAEGIDSGQKITLRLDEQARLVLSGSHPDEQKLAELLKARPDMASAFAAIAFCSALLRDLRGLQIAACSAGHPEACMTLLAASSRNGYQISLKGDMNHFYFSR